MDLVDLKFTTLGIRRRGEAFEGALADFILWIGFVVSPGQRDHAGANEAADIIDMTVCLVVKNTFSKPDEFFDAEIVGQCLFDFHPGQGRIAVVIEQAFLGRHQRAFAIGMDGTAFQNDGGRIPVLTFDMAHFERHEIILVPGEIEAVFETAPGVEPPVDGAHIAFAVDDKGRTAIAHP